MTDDGHTRHLVRMRLRRDREVVGERASRPQQEPLPFEDGFLDGRPEEIEFHGTNVGLRLHAESDTAPCDLCARFLDELAEEGLVRRLDGV